MEIHATLVCAPGWPADPGEGPRRLPGPREIVINGSGSGAEIAAALGRRWGRGRFTVGGLPLEELRPGHPPLVSGSVIVGAPDRRGTSEPVSVRRWPELPPLFLAVEEGPAAGDLWPLARGRYRIGRAPSGFRRLTVADPAVSREHAQLSVDTDSVRISGPRSAGPAGGGIGPRGRLLASGTELAAGDSVLRLLSSADLPDPSAADDAETPLTVAFSGNGAGPMVLVGAMLALAAGIVLASVTGSWLFLVFSALSAVTAVVGIVHGRHRRRRTRRLLQDAAARDLRRRRQAWPGPGALVLRCLAEAARAEPPEARSAPDEPLPADGVGKAAGLRRHGPRVRIGRGAQPARVALSPAPPEQPMPPVVDAPVVLDLAPGRVGVSGTRGEVAALLRSILLQLAAGPVPVAVTALGLPAQTAASARFLPGVRLLPAGSGTAPVPSPVPSSAPGAPTSRVLILGPGCPPDAAGACGPVAADECVLDCRAEVRGARIELGPDGARFRDGGQWLSLRADGLGATAFDRACRALAARGSRAGGRAPAALPPAVPLGSLYRSDRAAFEDAWAAPPDGLPVRLGVGGQGPVDLDLVRDGPHLLVAGTTGAGKSDLLRTLIAGLAARSSPARVNFLLVDFKGGAGLAPLAGLPHTVGLLTSLGAGNATRTLVSLQAELRRREALFAAAGCPDLPAFNAANNGREMPRLVVVVDEFRVLSEEVPDALGELMRIASLGRSLGLHLVLATQRPQGAVSAEIRANVSAAVCLRVQSEAESRDVVGIPAAAGIPASAPGRGYLRRGSSPPVLFQAGCFALPQDPPASVSTFAEYLAGGRAPEPRDTSSAGEQLVAAAASAAAALSLAAVRRPVAEPLPERCPAALAAEPDQVALGVLDLPRLQARTELRWRPDDGHVAMLGLPGSGADEALSALLAGHLHAFPGRPAYLLDGDGSLAWAAQAPQVGAWVRPDDPARAVRVLRRLVGLEATLLVSAWGAWLSALRGLRGADAEELLADLARGNRSSRTVLAVAGGRELPSARFFGFLPNRFFLPAGAGPETLLSWPAMPGTDPLPGRAYCLGPAVRRAQAPLAAGFPDPPASGPGGARPGTRRDPDGAVAQLAAADESFPLPAPPPLPRGATRPARVDPLPRAVPAAALPDAVRESDGSLLVPVGVSGDELEATVLRLRAGDAFLVLGRAGSGRSSLLEHIRVSVGHLSGCLVANAAEPLDAAASAAEEGREVLIIADDADRLPPARLQQVSALLAAGARVVLSAAPGPGLPTRVPPAAAVRARPLGALLAGTGALEQDLFGFRPDASPEPRPGRGWLITPSAAVQAQFALPGSPVPFRRRADRDRIA